MPDGSANFDHRPNDPALVKGLVRELLADVIVSKLVDHLPLYRQEQRCSRQGFLIARSTQCGWLVEAADVLSPLSAS